MNPAQPAAPNHIQPYRRLPLEGTHNTRDLGGYPCGGGVTRWGVFLRSDNPADLTANDVAYLKAYGVCCAVDLRRADERARMPSALEEGDGFTCHHVSMQTGEFSLAAMEGDLPGSMAGLYLGLLDGSCRQIAEVMMYLAQTPGAALFHCAVGKDRTGVIAMLLLKLAGVADADVVADYTVTDVYIREIMDRQNEVFKAEEVPAFLFQSVAGSMWRTLRHLQQTYGTAEDYLLWAGVPQSEVNRLKEKFVQRV